MDVDHLYRLFYDQLIDNVSKDLKEGFYPEIKSYRFIPDKGFSLITADYRLDRVNFYYKTDTRRIYDVDLG